MYLPDHFAEHDPAELRRLMAEYPLATLVTLGAEGINANHLPFAFHPEVGEQGVLRTHVARNNAVWRDFSPAHEALVIFQGPSAYISPTWYPTKAETHRHVPTYNYAVVHAYGRIAIHDDARWLRALLGRLTKAMEASQPQPWKMGDAPQDYLEGMIAQVVGLELAVTRLVGKWKVSQNRLPIDRAGAARGLRAGGDPAGATMADLIEATNARRAAR